MPPLNDTPNESATVDLQSSVRTLIAENSGVELLDSISNTDDLFAAGLQSLDCVRILVAVEDEFDIELPNDIIERKLFCTVENLSQAVAGLVGEQG
jgi:acyl carrier protein